MFACVLILGMFLGYKLSNQSGEQVFSPQSSSHLDDLIKLISERYVDSLDEQKLYRNGIDGILKTLDPHTVYIPAEELGRVNEELEGTFYGIGVEFYLLNDTVVISAVLPGGPSQQKDIIPGDKIIRIDDTLVAGKKLDEEEVIRRIKGRQNTTIHLELLRLDGSHHKIEIARDQVPLKSVSAFFKIDEETGFIKIDMFSETTYDEFKQALDSLTSSGIKKLIIDVRENPGGYMDAVASVADELVAGTHTIVSTRGKQQKDSLVTSVAGLYEKGSLSILVDENSASASEILAGSIQDLDRGMIVGRRTYGKGLVQEQFELPDHSAIRITTARYYLPSGRCIQRSYANGKEKYKHDIIDRFKSGELEQGDSTHESSKPFYTASKKVVYGNEGITPDIFVPLDTVYHNQLDDFYTAHISEEFAHWYFFYHKNELNSYKNLTQFSNEFEVSDTMMKAMKSFLAQHKISSDILSNKLVYAEVIDALRSQFARMLFGNNGKYRELYRNDEFVKKALEVMVK